MEDLEARWKRCQELGVQADVELQRAARKVIDENNMLREILAEMGVGREEVERRLRGLRAGSAARGGGEVVVVVPDNGCDARGGCGGGAAGQQPLGFPGVMAGLEGGGEAPAVPPGIEALDLSQLDLDIDIPEFGASTAAAGTVNETPAAAADFSMNLMEPMIPDFDSMFDISEFIEQPVIKKKKRPFCLCSLCVWFWFGLVNDRFFSSLTFPCQWDPATKAQAPPLLPPHKHSSSRWSLLVARFSQPQTQRKQPPPPPPRYRHHHHQPQPQHQAPVQPPVGHRISATRQRPAPRPTHSSRR